MLVGANKKTKPLERKGITVSLLNNLMASAMACNKPKTPTILGPRLRCIEPKIFLSKIVKKATNNKIGTTKGKTFKKSKPKLNKNKNKKSLNKKKKDIKINLNFL